MDVRDFNFFKSRGLGCEGVDSRRGKLKKLIIALGSRGRFRVYPGGRIQRYDLDFRDNGSSGIRHCSPDSSVDVGACHRSVEETKSEESN